MFIANTLLNVPVTEFCKSVNIWWSYEICCLTFLGPPGYILHRKPCTAEYRKLQLITMAMERMTQSVFRSTSDFDGQSAANSRSQRCIHSVDTALCK